MICIIATSHQRARNWANNQGLEDSEWFYVDKPEQLISYQNFHTIVIESFPDFMLGMFEKIYHTAKRRGAIGRK